MTPEQRARQRINAIKERIADYRQGCWNDPYEDAPPCPHRKPAPPRPCPASSQGKRWRRLRRQYASYLAWHAATEQAMRVGDRRGAAIADLRAEVALFKAAGTILALGLHIPYHYRLLPPHLPGLVQEILADAGFPPE